MAIYRVLSDEMAGGQDEVARVTDEVYAVLAPLLHKGAL